MSRLILRCGLGVGGRPTEKNKSRRKNRARLLVFVFLFPIETAVMITLFCFFWKEKVTYTNNWLYSESLITCI